MDLQLLLLAWARQLGRPAVKVRQSLMGQKKPTTRFDLLILAHSGWLSSQLGQKMVSMGYGFILAVEETT